MFAATPLMKQLHLVSQPAASLQGAEVSKSEPVQMQPRQAIDVPAELIVEPVDLSIREWQKSCRGHTGLTKTVDRGPYV